MASSLARGGAATSITFQHSQLGAYIVAVWVATCFALDSFQSIIDRYGHAKRWWWFSAVLGLFVYLYVRPYIRIGLGSASHGRINYSTCYAVWLCGAVFYHLPSLKAMGIDIRADVSMFIVVFMSTLAALLALWALHEAAVRMKLVKPKISAVPPGARMMEVLGALLLNSANLALACSSYHSVCGNGLVGGQDSSASASDTGHVGGAARTLRAAICAKWLHPVPTQQYPSFSAWMLYGEGVNNTSNTSIAWTAQAGNLSLGEVSMIGNASSLSGMGSLTGPLGHTGAWIGIDFPLDGEGPIPVPAGSVLSPVLTMWITLMLVYVANSVADHAAADSLHAAHMAELRQEVPGEPANLSYMWKRYGQRSFRRADRDRDAGGVSGPGSHASSGGAAGGRGAKLARPRSALDVKKTISKTSSSPSLSAAAAAWGKRVLRSNTMQTLVRDTEWLGHKAAGLWDKVHGTWDSTCTSLGVYSDSSRGGGGDGRRGGGGAQGVVLPDSGGPARGAAQKGEAAQPAFLPMVPWYSGTSADLLKTCLDLMLSVKVFLGRFDMRTMQSATAASMTDTYNEAPAEGDGFTYEQYESRDELWLDFIADTGDGGNSTYTVARALAATQLPVHVPTEFESILATGQLPGTSPGRGPDAQSHGQTAGKPPVPTVGEAGRKLQHSDSKGSVHVSQGGAGGAGGGGGALIKDKLVLPRAQVLLLGGDLAYPNPTKETYEQRLLRPFQDALPPPPHYHPERLVVHKPDLPPMYGVQEAALPGGLRGLSPRASRHASSAALRAYSGPSCFAIPGNHDWIDGLETFINYIQHKGWLGGWLLPQEKSYMALKLPHGWWLFGLDLALTHDIDMCQLRYFANVVEQRLTPDDNVILITHEPVWLLEWFWQDLSAPHLRQLIRGHLRGRARVHLAGDLHFYMRHSYQPPAPPPAAAPASAAQMKHPAGPGSSAGSTTSGTKGKHAAGGGVKTALNAAGAAAAVPPRAQHSRSTIKQATTGGPNSADHTVSGASGEGSTVARHSSAGNGPETSSLGVGLAGSAGSTTGEVTSSRVEAGSYVQGSRHKPAWSHQGSGSLATEAAVRAVTEGMSRHASGLPGSSPPGSAWGQGSGVVGGSSDEESESNYSTASTRSWRRLGRERGGTHRPVGLKAFGKQLPNLCVQDLGISGSYQAPGPIASSLPPLKVHLSGGGAAAGAQNGLGQPPVEEPAPPMGPCDGCQARMRELQHHTFDPEHLICNGAGGAFLHPTHIFAPAAFYPASDAAAEATAALYSAAQLPCTCRVHPHDAQVAWGAGAAGFNTGWAAYSHPSSFPAAAFLKPTPTGQHATGVPPLVKHNSSAIPTGQCMGTRGQYTCQVAYPSPDRSSQLGFKNLHLFRLKNTRFDVIGGVLYFLLVVSIMPRCSRLGPPGAALLASVLPTSSNATTCPQTCLSDAGAAPTTCSPANATTSGCTTSAAHLAGGVAAILDAETLPQMLVAAAAAYADAMYAIIMDSYVSLAMAFLLLMTCVGLARSGGVGAVKEWAAAGKPAPSGAPRPGFQSSSGTGHFNNPAYPQPKFPVRVGGLGMQLLWGGGHALAHLSCAVVLLLMLELGVEMCIRHEQLGRDGLHSLYRWYQQFETEHFPDPQGVRVLLQRCTLGLYPGVIKGAMAVFDIPEVVAVTRIAVCNAQGTMEVISRLQALAYYGGMLAYYWVLATPAVGAIFGLYLFVSVVWAGVHYDEAFASLRLANHKSITRMHITPDGDLQMYTLAIDKVPSNWQEDPRWHGPHGAGNPSLPAHFARVPSRWVPTHRWWQRRAPGDSRPGSGGGMAQSQPQNSSRAAGRAAGDAAGGRTPGRGGGSGAAGRVGKSEGGARGGSHEGHMDDEDMGWKLVDYVHVPRRRVYTHST